MQFKRNMVELVYKKIKNEDIGKAQVKEIASDDSRYKAVVLKEIDTPGNKKLRYPKTGEKVYNKKDKGFIHPGVDLPPKYRSVIPKPEPIGTKTIRQFREQMTPVRPAFGKSFEPVYNTFLPGKLPNIFNMWLRRSVEPHMTPVTAEASSSHHYTALRSVLSEIESIDRSRTYTNNIIEIFNYLGIESARQAIINELEATLLSARLEVDVRHLLMVADVMTSEGEVRAIGRHGVSGTKHSILARAAFEVTVNHLLKAGIIGETDRLTGVAENIIVGQPISLGTGSVELFYIPEE